VAIQNIQKLSAARIERIIKDGKTGMYGDGGNLWLQITNNGAGASWVLRWTERGTGRERSMGLGSLHTIGLERARELAKDYRQMLLEGKDPKAERDSRLLDDQIARGLAKTVSQVADEYFEAKIARKSAEYREQTERWLKVHVHKPIGHMPVQKIDRNTILEKCGLRDMWTRQHVKAVMLRVHLDRMFKLAIANGYYHGENPASWSHLQYTLPSSGDVHTPKHRESLPYQDAFPFLEKLRAFRYTTNRFAAQRHLRPVNTLWIEVLLFTGVRPGEARKATWREFDEEHMVWTVPWQHLKSGHKHHTDRPIPITKPMLAVVGELKKHRTDQSPDALAFPGQGGRMLGDSIVSHFIKYSSFEWDAKALGRRCAIGCELKPISTMCCGRSRSIMSWATRSIRPTAITSCSTDAAA